MDGWAVDLAEWEGDEPGEGGWSVGTDSDDVGAGAGAKLLVELVDG